MFKGLRGGRRNAQATGGTSRVKGLIALRPNATAPAPRRTAFLGEVPQESTRRAPERRVDKIN
jgi:hypothetical protein